jgi:hypothetical protein
METIEECLLEVPPTAPNYRQALRAAYRATSHDENGKIRPAHLLLQRDSRLLPEDERKPILKARQNLAARLKAPAPTRAAAKIPATPQPRPTPAIASAITAAIAHSFSPARTLTPGQAPGLPIATPAEMARMVAEMDAQLKRQKNARAELHLGGARPTPTNFMNASG